MPENPYASPKEAAPPVFTDISQADLERRVAELERQVAGSWFRQPRLLPRVIAVWAYFMIGYIMLAVILAPIAALLIWLVE